MITFDFSGCSINKELSQKISDALNEVKPFGLKSRRGNIAVFVPKHLIVFWQNNRTYLGNAVIQCRNQQEFLNAIGTTVLGHKEFIDVPKYMIENINQLDEQGFRDTEKLLS